MKFSRRIVLSTSLIVTLLCVNSIVFGDSIAIKDDQIFIADKGLTVKNLLTGTAHDVEEQLLRAVGCWRDLAGERVT